GTLEQRVAYGSLVLFDDVNDNERLNLTGGCPRRRNGEMRPPDMPMKAPREPLQAASFVTLTSAQTRIAYVEGDFDADSFFYPHPSCAELPPRGFSTWIVGDMLDPNAGCAVKPIDEEIVLQLDAAPGSLLDLSCLASERESFPRPPPDDGVPEDVIFDCLPDGTLVTADPQCPCPNLRQYALRGCFD